MPDFVMKQGDTLPLFEFTVKDANGPVNISTAQIVKLHIVRGDNVVVNGTCVVIDDGTEQLRGMGRYEWQVSDTDDEFGTYDIEVEVTYGIGKILTFPNGSKNPKLQINKQLA